MVSARTRWETQAPRATQASAAPAWRSSSRVRRRTRRFVSTARMPLPDVGPDPGLQLREAAPPGRAAREESLMHLGRREPAGPAHDDALPVLAPLDHRTGADPEAAPHLGGDGDLTLRGDARLGDLVTGTHGCTLP